MIMHRPFLKGPVLAALAGVLTAAFSAGCSRESPPPPHSLGRGAERKVEIPVKVDADGNVTAIGWPVSDDPDSCGVEAALSKDNVHHIKWTMKPPKEGGNPSGTLIVAIKQGFPDPFEKGIDCSAAKSCDSGKVRPDVNPGPADDRYRTQYSITILNKNGTKPTKDPNIRVDP
jgi:hypothetical protein